MLNDLASWTKLNCNREEYPSIRHLGDKIRPVCNKLTCCTPHVKYLTFRESDITFMSVILNTVLTADFINPCVPYLDSDFKEFYHYVLS